MCGLVLSFVKGGVNSRCCLTCGVRILTLLLVATSHGAISVFFDGDGIKLFDASEEIRKMEILSKNFRTIRCPITRDTLLRHEGT